MYNTNPTTQLDIKNISYLLRTRNLMIQGDVFLYFDNNLLNLKIFLLPITRGPRNTGPGSSIKIRMPRPSPHMGDEPNHPPHNTRTRMGWGVWGHPIRWVVVGGWWPRGVFYVWGYSRGSNGKAGYKDLLFL